MFANSHGDSLVESETSSRIQCLPRIQAELVHAVCEMYKEWHSLNVHSTVLSILSCYNKAYG